MIKKFKLWLYYFIVGRLLDDETFIMTLFNRLKDEEGRREELKDAEKKAKIQKEIDDLIQRKKDRQSACRHLKGGRLRPAYGRDYNIWDHTFPDGTRTVRCLTCSKEWKGEELKSEEVENMLFNTTNTLTSSEVNLEKPKDQGEMPFIGVTAGDRKSWAEMETNPLWPFASRGYIKWWDKMYKKLTRKKKVK